MEEGLCFMLITIWTAYLKFQHQGIEIPSLELNLKKQNWITIERRSIYIRNQ